MLVKDLLKSKSYQLNYDDNACLERQIDFHGEGWYSLNNNDIYKHNQEATYSRIQVTYASKLSNIS